MDTQNNFGEIKQVNQQKKTKRFRLRKRHLGFTNWLAICIMLFLAAGLTGGYHLAILSIKSQYTGALLCWTVVFTPIGTACSIVLSRIVDKSRAENTSANGDGIKYATAAAHNFMEIDDYNNSPEI